MTGCDPWRAKNPPSPHLRITGADNTKNYLMTHRFSSSLMNITVFYFQGKTTFILFKCNFRSCSATITVIGFTFLYRSSLSMKVWLILMNQIRCRRLLVPSVIRFKRPWPHRWSIYLRTHIRTHVIGSASLLSLRNDISEGGRALSSAAVPVWMKINDTARPASPV